MDYRAFLTGVKISDGQILATQKRDITQCPWISSQPEDPEIDGALSDKRPKRLAKR
jgi:hypothetical protein